MNGFRTDNEVLGTRAEVFRDLAERADRIAGELRAEVTEHGECWGADEVGVAFAEGHVAPAEAALTGLGRVPGGLAGIGTSLIATAAAYAASEHTSRTAIAGVGDAGHQDT